jgi:hypothetical protein
MQVRGYQQDEDVEMSTPPGIEKLREFFCGCATEETTWLEVYRELERAERSEYAAPDKIVMHLCHWADLTTHGSGIRGAWLTDSGKETLNWMRTSGSKDWSEDA